MKKIRLAALSLLLWVFFVGCSSNKNQPWATSMIPTGIPSDTPLRLSPTISKTNSTSIVVPMVSPSPIIDSSKLVGTVIQNCVTTTSPDNGNLIRMGSVVYRQNNEGGLVVLSRDTVLPQVIASDPRYFSVSPYTGTIAWAENDSIYKFRLSDGEVIEIPFDKSWMEIRQWLPDDRIIVPIKPVEQKAPYKAKDEIYVISLNTGEKVYYTFTMSDYFSEGIVSRDWVSYPLYSANLKFAIYAWKDPETFEYGMLLWDTQNAKELWRRGKWGGPVEYSQADWQFNSDIVVIPAPPVGKSYPWELFTVSGDGVETQLTNLEDFSPSYLIFDTLFSPDNRYIAFIYNNDIDYPLEKRFLYILDTQSGNIIDYCISPIDKMAWSPNSDQIALSYYDRPELVILDIQSGKAQTILDARELLGWVSWSLP